MTKQKQPPAIYAFNKRPGDGAHWGVDEPYPEVIEELMRALDSNLDFDTGWYSSKKEIESGRVERRGDVMWASVSKSDDFDNEAVGEADFPFADLVGKDSDERMTVIGAALDAARDMARDSQRDNESAAIYCIGRDEGAGLRRWTFTYLRDVSGFGFEKPPGDSYHRWGWQEVDTDDDSDREAFPSEIGEEAAAKIVEAVHGGDVDDAGKDGLVVDGWRVVHARE
jgi:hypothetical protein